MRLAFGPGAGASSRAGYGWGGPAGSRWSGWLRLGLSGGVAVVGLAAAGVGPAGLWVVESGAGAGDRAACG
ncbi:hypothetical protein Ate02nite_45260 [Paractinoplanes tereljensis]|uniref:Uncharacterized protein n=1 Tax=Paractinoplanes tereljensis TaxID=571912 RepID=A0A919NMY8_9ACTN|nr:hypothetical protein Ate02nite_45260 [Actinoplanes tereljensis]